MALSLEPTTWVDYKLAAVLEALALETNASVRDSFFTVLSRRSTI